MTIQRFRQLQKDPTFVMPNPWDAGSAKTLHAPGFTRIQALFSQS